MQNVGHKIWAVPGGHIPLRSTGHEPEHTSYDKIYLLNINKKEANVEITIYYANREPVGPYKVIVPTCRLRTIRYNDLIDPEAIPLDTDYSSVIKSNIPIIVQFTRQDTSSAKNATCTTLGFPLDTNL